MPRLTATASASSNWASDSIARKPGAGRYEPRHHRGQINVCPVKIAKGTVYVRRFAAYVEDGAGDPEQALMEISNSHARYSEDSPIAPSCFEQRAAVDQSAGDATAGDADPDSLPRHRTHRDGQDHGGHTCQ